MTESMLFLFSMVFTSPDHPATLFGVLVTFLFRRWWLPMNLKNRVLFSCFSANMNVSSC